LPETVFGNSANERRRMRLYGASRALECWKMDLAVSSDGS